MVWYLIQWHSDFFSIQTLVYVTMICFVLVVTMWKMVNHLCGRAWMILLWGNVKDWLCSQWVSGYFISHLQLSQVKLVSSSFASRFVLVVIWFLCMWIWMDLHLAFACMYLNVTHNKVKYIWWLGVYVVTISILFWNTEPQ